RCAIDLRCKGTETILIGLDLGGHSHSHQRAPMKGIIEHDYRGSPRCVTCDFHRVLNSLSATVEEECLLREVTGGDFDDTFRQIDIWLIHHHTEAGMGEFLCLLDDSLCHFWARMPNVH